MSSKHPLTARRLPRSNLKSRNRYRKHTAIVKLACKISKISREASVKLRTPTWRGSDKSIICAQTSCNTSKTQSRSKNWSIIQKLWSSKSDLYSQDLRTKISKDFSKKSKSKRASLKQKKIFWRFKPKWTKVLTSKFKKTSEINTTRSRLEFKSRMPKSKEKEQSLRSKSNFFKLRNRLFRKSMT